MVIDFKGHFFPISSLPRCGKSSLRSAECTEITSALLLVPLRTAGEAPVGLRFLEGLLLGFLP